MGTISFVMMWGLLSVSVVFEKEPTKSPPRQTVHVLGDTGFVTGDGLKDLAKLKNVRILKFFNTQITKSTLAKLSKLKKLEVLDLFESWMTNEAMKHLGILKNIKVLTLPAVRESGSALEYCSELQNLRQLKVPFARITEKGFKHIARMKNLQELDLSYSQLSLAGLSHLAELPELSKLSVASTNVTAPAITQISRLKQLKELDLSCERRRFIGLKDAALQSLSKLTGLERLSLAGNEQLTDKCLKVFSGMMRLQYLNVARTSISDDGVKALRLLFPKLEIEQLAPAPLDARIPPAHSPFTGLFSLSGVTDQILISLVTKLTLYRTRP